MLERQFALFFTVQPVFWARIIRLTYASNRCSFSKAAIIEHSKEPSRRPCSAGRSGANNPAYVRARDVPADGIELIELRQMFSLQILAQLHDEDVWLDPQLLKTALQYVATLAQAFKQEMGGLLDAYKQWALCWPTERALSEWGNIWHGNARYP